MNSRSNDFLVSFIIAVLVHAAFGFGAAAFMARANDRIFPAFDPGESGLELTIQSLPRPPEPEHLVVFSEPASSEPEQEMPEPEAPQFVDDSADALDKGVEGDVLVTCSKIKVPYPIGARKRNEEGIVTLRVQVDARGRARLVEIVKSSGYSALDRAAVKAAQAARYGSASGQRLPDSSETVFTIVFRLLD